MTKNRKSKRTNDLLQLTVMIVILMSFAGYEAGQKKPADKSGSGEYSKSSSKINRTTNQQDSLRLTRGTLHSNSYNSFRDQ